MAPFQQYAILIIGLIIPLFLIITKRDLLLLAWIAFTVAIQIFDSQIIINLPAARLVGLLTIPSTLIALPKILANRPGKLLIIHFVYLVLLGVLFGFIFPWPDEGLVRTFRQIAPGRASIYIIRSIADIGIILFVARSIIRENEIRRIFKYMIFGTTTAAIGGIIEYITHIDIYGLITGLHPMSLEHRMRGFNYEPRGLGLIAAEGMLLSLLLFSRHRSGKYLVLALVHAFSVFIAGSTSAIVALFCGIIVLFLYDKKTRSILLTVIGFAAVIVGLFIVSSAYFESFVNNINRRLTTERMDRPAANVIEAVAFRMDIFDGPALLFLADNPIYLIIGTGPGLIPLPATKYLLPSVDFKWVAETGINSPPTTGILLELSNTGFIGLALWFGICMASVRALKNMAKMSENKNSSWDWGASAFVTIATIYLVQTSPLSAIWPLFIGIGIGAAYLHGRHFKNYRNSASSTLHNAIE